MTPRLPFFARTFVLACLLTVGFCSAALAQPPNFLTPNIMQRNAGLTPYHLATVNTAMIECPFGGTLAAIVQSDFDGIYLHVDYADGTTVNGPILVANAQWGMADVAIGDDINFPGDKYVIAVTYKKLVSTNPLTYEIHIKRYLVEDVTGALTVTPIIDFFLGYGDDPKIDVIANETNIIGNYPAMDKFMMLFSDAGGTMQVLTAYTDFTGLQMFTGPTGYHATDIAAVKDITSGGSELVACISALAAGNTQLWVIEMNLTTSGLAFGFLQAGLATYNSRIEAFGVYHADNGFAKWAVTTSDLIQKIMLYTDNTAPYYCNPQAYFSGSSQEYPALASGIGPIYGPTSYIGNGQYSYAWGAPASQRYFSQALDLVGNPIAPIDFHIVNNSPCYMLVDPREAISMANSCNSGYDMIVAWNEGTNIKYKQLNNSFLFKGKGIDRVKELPALTLFPNPARDKVAIRCKQNLSQLTVLNSVGAQVHRQDMHTGETLVDVSQLAAGTYFVRMSGQDGIVTKPLVITR